MEEIPSLDVHISDMSLVLLCAGNRDFSYSYHGKPFKPFKPTVLLSSTLMSAFSIG